MGENAAMGRGRALDTKRAVEPLAVKATRSLACASFDTATAARATPSAIGVFSVKGIRGRRVKGLVGLNDNPRPCIAQRERQRMVTRGGLRG